MLGRSSAAKKEPTPANKQAVATAAPKAKKVAPAPRKPSPAIAPEGKSRAQYKQELYQSIEATNKTIKRQTWIIGITFAVAVFFGLTKDYFVYFAATEDGRMRELQPLSHPLMERSQWISFAQDGAVAANTYRFNTLERDMNNAQKYFTREGWASFEKAMIRSGNLVRAGRNQQTNNAFVERGSGTIVKEGLDAEGRAYRLIQFPMTVHSYARSEEQTYNFTVEVVVVRVHEADYPRGIAINEFRAK